MTSKRFEYVEPEIIDYDTDHLDRIEGNVSDYADEPHQVPAVRPQRNLVLPTQRDNSGVANVLGQLMTPAQRSGEVDAIAIQHMQAMSEKSSPRERSTARLILWGGWAVVAGILSLGLYMVGLRGDLVWGVFVAVVGYGVIRTTQDENKHSPAGVERHKTEAYRDVRLAQIKAEDRANERSHETFREVLKHTYGGRQDV